MEPMSNQEFNNIREGLSKRWDTLRSDLQSNKTNPVSHTNVTEAFKRIGGIYYSNHIKLFPLLVELKKEINTYSIAAEGMVQRLNATTSSVVRPAETYEAGARYNYTEIVSNKKKELSTKIAQNNQNVISEVNKIIRANFPLEARVAGALEGLSSDDLIDFEKYFTDTQRKAQTTQEIQQEMTPEQRSATVAELQFKGEISIQRKQPKGIKTWFKAIFKRGK